MTTNAERYLYAREKGLIGITHDGTHYTCWQCGNRWRQEERYPWWPLRFGWSWVNFGLSHHGWEVDAVGIEQRRYGHTLRIGWLLVNFGRRSC